MAKKYINKMTDKDLKELKEGMWTHLIFGKDNGSFENGQAHLKKLYDAEQKAEEGTSTNPLLEAFSEKNVSETVYILEHSRGFLNSIKKWYYGEKKFNRLILEKRETDA
jgi:hypothetical protein